MELPAIINQYIIKYCKKPIQWNNSMYSKSLYVRSFYILPDRNKRLTQRELSSLSSSSLPQYSTFFL